MTEASVPQKISLPKFVLYHVLIFNKSCEKRGTVNLCSLQYYDFILKTLPVKLQKSHLRESTFQNFPGEHAPRPPYNASRLRGSLLAPPPEKTITLATPLSLKYYHESVRTIIFKILINLIAEILGYN